MQTESAPQGINKKETLEGKQFRVSMDEVANGVGTKTDVGKLEMHLMCTNVYSSLYNARSNKLIEPCSLADVMQRYIGIIGMIQEYEPCSEIYEELLDLKLSLASIKYVAIDYVELVNMMLVDELQVLMYGKYKYSANNWKKIDPPLRYMDAFGRHLLHMMDSGNDIIDDESGLPALSHCMCNLSFFAELILTRDPYDGYDRWVEREKSNK